ncbi:MAG: hypothetical protein ABIA83_01250 [Patescibacteria group bacterium]
MEGPRKAEERFYIGTIINKATGKIDYSKAAYAVGDTHDKMVRGSEATKNRRKEAEIREEANRYKIPDHVEPGTGNMVNWRIKIALRKQEDRIERLTAEGKAVGEAVEKALRRMKIKSEIISDPSLRKKMHDRASEMGIEGNDELAPSGLLSASETDLLLQEMIDQYEEWLNKGTLKEDHIFPNSTGTLEEMITAAKELQILLGEEAQNEQT